MAQDIDLGVVEGLKGPIRGGTASQSNPNDGIPHIGKTGSTDDFIHTWMLGASRKVATVVWVGNVSGFVSLAGTSLNGVSGGSIRHIIWRAIMTEADRIYGGTDWAAPDSKFLSGRSATIPDVRGLSLADAQKMIESVHLTFVNGGVLDSNVATGQVVQIKPAAGKSVPTATIIKVYTSNGTGIAVPNFIGLTQQDAEALAIQSPNNWTIVWKVVNTPQTCSTPSVGAQPTCVPTSGLVTAQSKPVGSFLSPGKTLTLTRQGP